jgi:hypothetical protein
MRLVVSVALVGVVLVGGCNDDVPSDNPDLAAPSVFDAPIDLALPIGGSCVALVQMCQAGTANCTTYDSLHAEDAQNFLDCESIAIYGPNSQTPGHCTRVCFGADAGTACDACVIGTCTTSGGVTRCSGGFCSGLWATCKNDG